MALPLPFQYHNHTALIGFPSSLAVDMNDRDERRFAEVSHESVRLMAESAGVELDDDVAALLAEDVCYRLREATQVSAGSLCPMGSCAYCVSLCLPPPQSSSQFMRHAKRRKLTVEDFNRALRWSNVEVAI